MLRGVDRFQEVQVSCFVSPGNVRFLLLHDGRSEDLIRSFFLDVHELYLKVTFHHKFRD